MQFVPIFPAVECQRNEWVCVHVCLAQMERRYLRNDTGRIIHSTICLLSILVVSRFVCYAVELWEKSTFYLQFCANSFPFSLKNKKNSFSYYALKCTIKAKQNKIIHTKVIKTEWMFLCFCNLTHFRFHK